MGLAQGGVHLLANDFTKKPLRRDNFDMLMQVRDRQIQSQKQGSKPEA